MKKTQINPLFSLSKKQIFWVLLAVVIAIFPHIPRLPFWFPILMVATVVIRWFTAINKIKPLPSILIAFITIIIFLAIIYFQGFSLNRELSVTVLTTMTVLKLLETWQKRDAWMVVTLCYFVILTRFFYSQDMLLVFYLLGSVFVITHTLFILQHNNQEAYLQKKEIKQTAGLLLAGIPLAALFFLFFPRLGSPIWGSPDLFGQGKSGMSDEMSPGSISQLFNDDSTAFRVTFKGEIPKNSQLYWRGPVLWNFDGFTWQKNKRPTLARRVSDFSKTGEQVTYEIELEPTGQNYLFALDYVNSPPIKTKILSDSQLINENKVNQLKFYQATSILKKYNPYEYLTNDKLQQLTALPRGYNKKTISMMHRWKTQNLSGEQLINKALNLFATDEFYYSYTPPLLQGDTVDQFLFETKSGFCEHYASAFTIMMRAAGLPARVVTGYQGGIVNKDYLLIKQSDAHAWSEVWVSGKGWLRVDPTAAVSPLRIESGSQALISQNARSWHDTQWYRKLGERYDAVRHDWNKWVRDYNVKKQQALFKIIGFESQDAKSVVKVLIIIMILSTLFVLSFLYITRPKRKMTYYDNIYNKYVKLFKNQDIDLTQSTGIIIISQKAINQFPNAKQSIDEFTQLYLKLRFSNFKKAHKTLDKRLVFLISKIKKEIKLSKRLLIVTLKTS